MTGYEDNEEEWAVVNMEDSLLNPKMERFTTTDTVIADVINGQRFGAYSCVVPKMSMLRLHSCVR